MNRSLRLSSLALAVLLSTSCAAEDLLLRQAESVDGLRFELSIDQPVIPVGDSGTLTIRLHNETAEDVQLSFGSTCQILPYVESEAGAMQYPGGGGWVCGAMITSLRVPANGSVMRTLVLRGVAANEVGGFGPSLRAGRYRTYATLESAARAQPSMPPRQLRSPNLEFEVR